MPAFDPARCAGFQWDQANAQKIWNRHRVTPAECEQAFLNRPLVIAADERHSKAEERLLALGRSDMGRRLFIVFTVRRDLIRVVSARDMSRKERRAYGAEE